MTEATAGVKNRVVDGLKRLASAFYERILVNPIALKELQAALRRLRFIVTLTVCLSLLALVLVLTILVTGSTTRGTADPSVIGQSLFFAFAMVQFSLVTLVFPAFSCTTVTEERVNKSFDLLITTCMQPWEIIFGKFLAAFIYTALFLVATIPLVAISFLFGGVTPGLIIVTYVVLFIYALAVSIFALFVSSASSSNARAIITSYLVAALVGSFVLGAVGGILTSVLFERDVFFQEFAAWWASPGMSPIERLLIVATPLFLLGSFFSFFFLMATNRLKPIAANKSTSLRVFFASFLAGACLIYLGYLFGLEGKQAIPWPNNPVSWRDEKMAMALCWWIGMAVILVLGALAFATEPVRLSLRLRNRLSTSRYARSEGPQRLLHHLARAGKWLFFPGGQRGAVFMTLVATGLLTISGALLHGPFGLGDLVTGMKSMGGFQGGDAIWHSVIWLIVFIFWITQVALICTIWLRSPTASKLVAAILVIGLTIIPFINFVIQVEGGGRYAEHIEFGIMDGHYLSPIVVGFALWGDASVWKESLDVAAFGSRYATDFFSMTVYGGTGLLLCWLNVFLLWQSGPRKLEKKPTPLSGEVTAETVDLSPPDPAEATTRLDEPDEEPPPDPAIE